MSKKVKVEHVIVIGCGRVGANIANQISEDGKDVVVVSNTSDSFRKLGSSFCGLTILGDGTDFHTLEDAQIKIATTVIAVTSDENTNIMVGQIAKKQYGVDKVIIRISDPAKECVYSEDDILTICPASLTNIAVTKLLNESEQ